MPVFPAACLTPDSQYQLFQVPATQPIVCRYRRHHLRMKGLQRKQLKADQELVGAMHLICQTRATPLPHQSKAAAVAAPSCDRPPQNAPNLSQPVFLLVV